MYLAKEEIKLSDDAYSLSQAIKNPGDTNLLNASIDLWNKDGKDYLDFCTTYK
jgi:hypothetical protein